MRINVKRSLIIAGNLFLVLHLSAQDNADTLRFSLPEAQAYSMEYNKTVKSSRIDIEVAKKKVQETTAIGLPQFSVSANYQHIFKIPEINFPLQGLTQDPLAPEGQLDNLMQTQDNFGGLNYYVFTGPAIPLASKNNTTFNFTLSQLIFSGEYLVGLQAARIYKEISEDAYEKSELTAKESVAGTYYLILVLDENLKVLNESVDLIQKTYSDIQNTYEQGFAEETDVDQIKINESNLKNMVISLEGQRDVAMKLLKIQMGIEFGQPVVLTDSLAGIIEGSSFGSVLPAEFNVTSSIDYKMVNNQVDINEASLRREKSKFLPTVSGFYQHQEQTNPAAFNFQPKDILGLSANLPIFTSTQRLATTAQARLNLEKSKLTRENVRQNLILEYESAKNDYQTAFLNYRNNKESMELSRKVYEKNLIKFNEGVATSLELTQSQNQYLTAEGNYYSSIISLLKAKAKVERILANN